MGLFNWASRQPKRTADYVKKVVAGEEIQKGGQYIADMAKGLRKDSGRRETFENAYQRLEMTDEKLQQSYKFYNNRFSLFLFFFGLGIAVFIFFMFQSFWSAISVFGFLAVCLSQMFNASFRMMQIRHRDLLPVAYWLRTPDEWWPRPLVLKKSKSSSKNQNVVPLRSRDVSNPRDR